MPLLFTNSKIRVRLSPSETSIPRRKIDQWKHTIIDRKHKSGNRERNSENGKADALATTCCYVTREDALVPLHYLMYLQQCLRGFWVDIMNNPPGVNIDSSQRNLKTEKKNLVSNLSMNFPMKVHTTAWRGISYTYFVIHAWCDCRILWIVIPRSSNQLIIHIHEFSWFNWIMYWRNRDTGLKVLILSSYKLV